MNQDPLTLSMPWPVRTIVDALSCMKKMQEIVKRGEINYPFLIYGGTNDKAVDAPAWQVFYDVKYNF